MKILLVADIKGAKTAAEAQRKLDAFREATLPGPEYGICLYQPDGALNPARPIIQLQEGEDHRRADDGLILIRNFDGCGNPAVFFDVRPEHVSTESLCPDDGGDCPADDPEKCAQCKPGGTLLKTLRMELEVQFAPYESTLEDLKQSMEQVITEAFHNGPLSGESLNPAELVQHEVLITAPKKGILLGDIDEDGDYGEVECGKCRTRLFRKDASLSNEYLYLCDGCWADEEEKRG